MNFADILRLALRNLREAKLRATLTTLGIIIGVGVIVLMVSFGLGLQRNTIERFRELDLFTQLTVFGKSLQSLAQAQTDGGEEETANTQASPTPSPQQTPRGDDGRRNLPLDSDPKVLLDDEAIAAIQKMPGVVAVEPNISFSVFQRANGRARQLGVVGAIVPNPSERFKTFSAGGMFTAPDAAEAVLEYRTLRDFGFSKPEDAVGKQLDFLSAPDKKEEAKEAEPTSFMGIPLEIEEDGADALVAKSFKIVGVLAKPEGDAARFRGFGSGSVYLPLAAARDWRREHRDEMSEVALQLARQSGQLKDGQGDSYISATVRVTDPVALTDVRNKLKDMGLGSFSIVDRIDEIRTFFLIMNAVLGLLGGISLLVASFGIANTMIMSILERTREIGIMKAIGAEDREIKLIFFVEAAVLGFIGGVIGVLMATGLTILANSLAYRFALKPQGASFINFFALPPWLWLGAILFAILVAIVAALYPASRAAKIDPVKALRHD
jgi:putative ABC transport system permease protein